MRRMKRHVQAGMAILAGVMAFGHAAALAQSHPLDPLRWKARLVVIASERPDDARAHAQRAALTHALNGLRERRASVLSASTESATLEPAIPGFQASGPELLAALDATEGFHVLLVGLDGEVKQRWRTPVDAATLFEAIDAMPMRQDELRQSFEG